MIFSLVPQNWSRKGKELGNELVQECNTDTYQGFKVVKFIFDMDPSREIVAPGGGNDIKR